jgi:hypothetical protein
VAAHAVAGEAELALEPFPDFSGGLRFDHLRVPRREHSLPVVEAQRHARLVA